MIHLIRKILGKVRRLIIKMVLLFVPLQDVILFESVPDYSDNTRAVFDEMIRLGINKRYRLVWISSTKLKELENLENVFFVNITTIQGQKKWRYYANRAKCLICCNRFLTVRSRRQKIFYLSHGVTIKRIRHYYTLPHYFDYCLTTSNNVIDLMSYELNFPADKFFALGYPRNDVFSKEPIDVKSFFEKEYNKIIVWYPTFRQSKNGRCTAVNNALPIIHDIEKAKQLNLHAKDLNVLLVIKPHFVQDVTYIKNLNLSNIIIIDDQFYRDKQITSYQFIAGCDALISDYSSVYFDYSLCDKPMAVVWEDIELYKKEPGLIDNYQFYLKGAKKIYTLEDLSSFLLDVANNVDELKVQRNEIKNLVHYANDGKNSERVVHFIIEKAGL